MDLHENMLKTYAELTEWRKKAKEIRKLKAKPPTPFTEIHKLGSSISMALKDIDRAGNKICNEADEIKYQLESDNSLHVGKDSVRPLIELKNIATEVFANIKEGVTSDADIKERLAIDGFTQEIDYEPAFQELEFIKKSAIRSKEFIRQLKFAAEGIEQLENELEETVVSDSTLSITGSDPSTSEFSLFESNTNVATSSPI